MPLRYVKLLKSVHIVVIPKAVGLPFACSQSQVLG